MIHCCVISGSSGTLRHRNVCFLSVCQGDLAAPDIPKSMAWCENSICVGFKRDYYLIRVHAAEKGNNFTLDLASYKCFNCQFGLFLTICILLN